MNDLVSKRKTIYKRKEQTKMKKKMKKIVSVMVAAVMVMMLGITSFAADVDITKPDKDTADHTYKAYQIFTGTKTESVPPTTPKTYYLTDIDWGDGVNSTTLLAKLKTLTDFASCTTAEDVASVLSTYDAEQAMDFAKIVVDYVDASKAKTSTTGSFTGLDIGYYLITDSVADGEYGAASAYMLKVVDIHTADGVEAKEEVPSIDKKIVENNEEVEANHASVGDKINYRITSKVPDLREKGYENYWFVITDTFSKGLKYNKDCKVYIGGVEYTNIDVSPATVGDGSTPTTIEITLKDFITLATDDSKVGKTITIEYSAELTKDCDMTIAGNVNTAQLTFSNDPNQEYDGDKPDPEGPNPPVGKTPEYKTKTYTTGIAVIKVDGNGKRLTGAEFEIELSGDSVKTVVIETEKYVKDASADPAYYLLPDGSYSTSSTGAVSTDKYSKTIERTTESTTATVKKVKGTVDDQGYLVFEGLGEGTYTIAETKAPTGYILDSEPHTVVIGHSGDGPTFDSANWTYKVDDGSASSAEVTLTFTNIKSSNLPETGGIGTTVFYIAGSILVLAGASLLIAKKKMSADETK